jgi:hypothetical protein
MIHQYGLYSSWTAASEAFGKTLYTLPENTPVKLWDIALVIFGEEHQDWAKDMVRQFVHKDAVEVAFHGDCIQETKYYVRHDVLDEMRI